MKIVRCELCERRADDPLGCAWHNFSIDGEEYERIKYEGDMGEHCPVCGTPTGHLHHVDCTQEPCPKCLEPLVSCKCDIEP